MVGTDGDRSDDVTRTRDAGERDDVSTAQRRVGTCLRGKWTLDELLGVGGMAAVYAATHRNGSRVAVKILHPLLSANADARKRFAREGYVANSVEHEGVVRVLDDDVAEDGAFFLVTELLSGETLEQRRVRLGGRLAESEVLAAIDQVLGVLVAAHAKGVVHRDLKPDNLFLTHSGHIKVLDFGIARMRAAVSTTPATRFGESMGTPAFMPPEQARGRWDEVDGTSDLWACGATMFTLLTGELVNDGPTPQEALLLAMTRQAPPLATLLPEASRAVAAIVDRALRYAKGERFPDAEAMREAVRQAYVERHHEPITTAPRLVPPERGRQETARGTASTAMPVARTSDPSVAQDSRARTAVAVIAVAGLALVTGLWAVRLRERSAPETGPGAPSVSASSAPTVATTASTLARAPDGDPAPPASAAPSSGASAPRPRTAPPGTPSPGKASAACTPPYTIDPTTMKKRWKVECL